MICDFHCHVYIIIDIRGLYADRQAFLAKKFGRDVDERWIEKFEAFELDA